MDTAQDDLDLVFAALADPTRRAIVERLTQGDASVNELAEPFAISQQAISKHLQVLERARLVSRTRVAQTRPVTLDGGRLEQATGWIERNRLAWAERHDRLAAHLSDLAQEDVA